MNKYMVRASLMLIGYAVLGAFVSFLIYLFTMFAPVEFIFGILFCIAAAAIVMFIAAFVAMVKGWIICKARELEKKEGIHV